MPPKQLFCIAFVFLWLAFVALALAYGNDSVHSLVAQDSSGEGESYSSCVYIGDGLFATNSHCVADSEFFTIVDPDRGVCYRAVVVAQNRRADVALLRSASEVVAPPARVAQADARLGDIVTAYGFGDSYQKHFSGGSVAEAIRLVRRSWRGPVVRYYNSESGGQEDAYSFRGGAVQGDSGGGVFNQNGELIAPLFGTSMGETFAVQNFVLRQMIQEQK